MAEAETARVSGGAPPLIDPMDPADIARERRGTLCGPLTVERVVVGGEEFGVDGAERTPTGMPAKVSGTITDLGNLNPLSVS